MSTDPPVVCFPFVGDAIGGSHRSALPLIAALPDHGFRPTVVVHHAGALSAELDRLGVEWQQAPPHRSLAAPSRAGQLLSLMTAARPLIGYVRSRGIAIVHTNDARMHRTWTVAARLGGASHVWHQRNAGLSSKMALIARSAHAILTVSQFARGALPEHLERRARVIDNPFDVTTTPRREQARARLAIELGVAPEKPVVAFAGMFIDRKRPEVFVDMAAILLDRGVDAVFPMFGPDDTPLAAQVRQRIVERRLDGHIKLMGFRSPLEDWIAASDILVAPSVAEPFARTVVESMIVGTPVIATDDGGNREIIISDRNGLLVDPDDPIAFAAATGRLLDDKGHRDVIARHARTTVVERFAIDRHARSVADIYRELLGR